MTGWNLGQPVAGPPPEVLVTTTVTASTAPDRPGAAVRALVQASALRAYADRHHPTSDDCCEHVGWLGDTCNERRQLLADADKIERGETP